MSRTALQHAQVGAKLLGDLRYLRSGVFRSTWKFRVRNAKTTAIAVKHLIAAVFKSAR